MIVQFGTTPIKAASCGEEWDIMTQPEWLLMSKSPSVKNSKVIRMMSSQYTCQLDKSDSCNYHTIYTQSNQCKQAITALKSNTASNK